MTLEKGMRLGPYEILSAIGAGGMGEVYLAMDTRLNRRVAIKVLPPQWSSNPDMKVRFDREAQIIAGLNHPHICTLHDIGHQDGTDYLVMEYIEGQTLADRIAKGPLPIEEAVRAAIEIASALDKAHREGITHRDLKPGNVMLTKSGVKLLDFGLAKQNAAVGTHAISESLLATSTDVTVAGTIVGTMQYMAPEQLEGKDATPQSDIFAFGAVLYEMVTGKKAFASENQATLISAIMTVSPPSLASVQSIDLPGLEYAVKKSLEKDPARRWQSARDLMDHLQWAGHRTEIAPKSQATVSERKPAGRWIPMLAIIATAIVFIWMATRFFQKEMPAEEIRFQFEANVADASFAISPNGHWIVYSGRVAGRETRSLLLRSMDSTASQPIAGTDDALAPFWSPDSKRLAFFSGTTLKTVAVSGGAPEVLCEAPGAERTGTWGKGDDIIFSTGEVLLRVPAAGGNAEPLTSLNISRAETGHVYPAFLPDGRHFLYAARSQQTADRAIYIGTLGSKDTTKLLPLVSPIHFSSGKLLYLDNGSLVARGFDADSLKFTGEPIRIAGQAAPGFTVSDRNVLIYQVGAPAEVRTFQYSWVDENGKLIAPVGKPEKYLPYWDLSPDGKKAAVSLLDGEPLAAHVWVLDLERGISSRITTGTDTGAAPRWSGDGQRLAYVTQQKGNRDIFARSASGLGSSEELLNSPEPETLDDWSPDSRYILYRTGANTNTIFALPLFGDRKPIKVVESEFNKAKSHLSADGKWLAYQAIESGGSQIYVVSFPKADQKRQISTAGGVQPQWRPDGKGLYFLSADGKMMSVDIITEPTLSSGTPRPLFDTGIAAPSFDSEEYATADGKRFLFLKLLPMEASKATAPPPPTIVVNWTEGLKDQKSK